jgi:hypothetical protein
MQKSFYPIQGKSNKRVVCKTAERAGWPLPRFPNLHHPTDDRGGSESYLSARLRPHLVSIKHFLVNRNTFGDFYPRLFTSRKYVGLGTNRVSVFQRSTSDRDNRNLVIKVTAPDIGTTFRTEMDFAAFAAAGGDDTKSLYENPDKEVWRT